MKQFHQILEADDIPELLIKEKEYFLRNPGQSPVFKRYFLSDRNQKRFLPQENGAISYIVQPPLDGSRAGVWLYSVSGAEVTRSEGLTTVSDDGVRHIWSSGRSAESEGSYSQTKDILEQYQDFLSSIKLNMSENCVRTWFFVDDIDNNYAGMVNGRRENFEKIGLTPETHYIASTGIFGKPCNNGKTVMMDAWAVDGIEKCSQKYLYAATHLNPTYEYGVTFERGVRLDFSGSANIIISGTASIDNKGNVLHIGDVAGQTRRMWKNVEVLMEEGGAVWEDIKIMLVYIRNVSDYKIVSEMFADRFPGTPYIILHAPVCRPDWLIEMECIASFDL